MLAISTATKKAYIALSVGEIKDFAEIEADCRQSENVLKEIDSMLEKNGLNFSEVGNIAVVIGPGSFTGIRIGVSLVKGLCAGDKNHLVTTISTLDFMAKENVKINKPNSAFVCVMNALSQRFFVATYDKNGAKRSNEKMITLEELLKIEKDKVFMKEEMGDLSNAITLSPQTLLNIALKQEKAKKLESASEIMPVYIRKSQAEENLH